MFLQATVNGLLLGGLYGIASVGFSMVWGVMGIINLAHTAFIMIGAYVTTLLYASTGLDPLASIPLAMATTFGLGYLLQAVILNRVLKTSLLLSLVVSFGVNLAVVDLFSLVFSSDVRAVNVSYAQASLEVAGRLVPVVRLVAAVFSVVLGVALYVVLRRTRMGQAILATALDREVSSLMGLDPLRVYALTAGVGAALAGATGSLASMIFPVTPLDGDDVPGGGVRGDGAGGDRECGGVYRGRVPLWADAVGGGVVPGAEHAGPGGVLPVPAGAGGTAAGAVRAGVLWGACLMGGRLMGGRWGLAAVVAGVVVLAAGPALVDAYWLRILTSVFMYAIVTQGLNVIVGITGYHAFGNAAFFGIGAYATGVLMQYGAPFPLALAGAPPVCAVVAGVLGWPILRLRGHYFAIATVALNLAMIEVIPAVGGATGGAEGLALPLSEWEPGPLYVALYWTMLGGMVVATGLVAWLLRTRLGYALRAIRDSERAAAVVGIDTRRAKVAAWAISAAITGFAGGVWAYWITFIEPGSAFDPAIGVRAYIMLILGGMGTVFGPVFGAFFLELLSTLVWANLLRGHQLILGVLIVVVCLGAPNGLLVAFRRRRRVRHA